MLHRIKPLAFVLVCTVLLNALGQAEDGKPGARNGEFEMQVDGRSIPVDWQKPISIAPSAQRFLFRIGAAPDPRSFSRVRFRFDGIDDHWREGPGEMFVAVRFLDAAGDQLEQVTFKAIGESGGWSLNVEPPDELGIPKLIRCGATLTHRREIVRVPPKASAFWITISSAGPPATVGCFAVSGMSVLRFPTREGEPELLVPPIALRGNVRPESTPPGWTRDGLRKTMAHVADFGPASAGLVLIDDDPFGHAEWRTSRVDAPRVHPGEDLLVEWNEAFSIGLADRIEVPYAVPASGHYRMTTMRVDQLGNTVDAPRTLSIVVHPPVWQQPWFWVAGCGIAGIGLLALYRVSARKRLREHARQLEQERTLQNERLRISRDLHDDLGARATHISLLSAAAEERAISLEAAREKFAQISTLSRQLIFHLYQTVWAVNPENDHLDALANHLCQLATKQRDCAQVRCRMEISTLPGELQVESQIRHHVSMAFSEAMHNAIKHGKATEITTVIRMEKGGLVIAVRDDGAGFDPAHATEGNGLRNMRQRIEGIGGEMSVESRADRGTEVRFVVPLARMS